MGKLSIFSWNVNGLRAVIRKGEFLKFIEKYQPDILLLQETKAGREQVEIDLPMYQEYWHSADRKGYSGTAIFSRTKAKQVLNGLPDDIVAQYKLDDGFGSANGEGRVVAAEFEQFYVLSVYAPNIKDDLSRIELRQHFDQALLEYLKQLENTKPVIFGGDLNVAHTPDDLARPKENIGKKGYTKEEIAGFQAYIDAGFKDTFRTHHKGNGYYTWWTHWANARARNVGWRIDYILVSAKLEHKLATAEIYPDIFGSDHCPVGITLIIE
jgi:exodeoxyribonuclease-3